MSKRVAFTFIELLVVLAIVGILAGILFPVFRSAKIRAQQSACMVNMRQTALATMMYTDDYDSRLLPPKYRIGALENPENDRTWVQTLLPYVKTFSIFRCPSDYSIRPNQDASFDADIVPGDTTARYYSASLKSDIGYSYLYHSPLVNLPSRGWTSVPRSTYEFQGNSIVLFVDSVDSQDQNGQPSGGGSYLIVPPCRFTRDFRDSFQLPPDATEFYRAHDAWSVSSTNGPIVKFGGTYPWHNGRMNVVFTDMTVKGMRPRQLSAGCIVEGAWTGLIFDKSQYLWDLE